MIFYFNLPSKYFCLFDKTVFSMWYRDLELTERINRGKYGLSSRAQTLWSREQAGVKIIFAEAERSTRMYELFLLGYIDSRENEISTYSHGFPLLGVNTDRENRRRCRANKLMQPWQECQRKQVPLSFYRDLVFDSSSSTQNEREKGGGGGGGEKEKE